MTSSTILRVESSIMRTFRSSSSGSKGCVSYPVIPRSGYFDLLEDLFDDRLAVDTVGLRLEADDDPVPEHVVSDRLDVLGSDKPAVPDKGVGAARARERDRGARRGPY